MRVRQQVTRRNFIESLRAFVPGFRIDLLWLEDEPLHYPIINDLARYVCTQMQSGNVDEVSNSVDFLEGLLKAEDSILRDLVHECLETLPSCVGIGAIKSYFGEQEVLDLWNSSFNAA